jgi:hypothetical protein
MEIKKARQVEHLLNLSFTPQWYPNAAPIQHEGTDYNIGEVIYPQKNTVGYNWGIEYQFTGKKGLILSIGIQSGVQNHKIRTNYNLGYVDEKYDNLYADTIYKGQAKYMTIRAMAGYRWWSPFKFSPAWNVDAKAGLALKLYRGVISDMYNWKIVEQTSDTSILITSASYETLVWGSAPPYATRLNYAGDFYIGASRKVNLSIIRSFSVGIEGTFGIFGGSSGAVYAELFQLDYQNPGLRKSSAYYTYAPKDFALGIRFAVGLGYWK